MAHGAEAAHATASGRPVISCVRPPGRYDSNDWNLARRSLPRGVRARPRTFRGRASPQNRSRIQIDCCPQSTRGCARAHHQVSLEPRHRCRRSVQPESLPDRQAFGLRCANANQRVARGCRQHLKKGCPRSTPTRRAAPPPGRRPRSPLPAKTTSSGVWPPRRLDARCCWRSESRAATTTKLTSNYWSTL